MADMLVSRLSFNPRVPKGFLRSEDFRIDPPVAGGIAAPCLQCHRLCSLCVEGSSGRFRYIYAITVVVRSNYGSLYSRRAC